MTSSYEGGVPRRGSLRCRRVVVAAAGGGRRRGGCGGGAGSRGGGGDDCAVVAVAAAVGAASVVAGAGLLFWQLFVLLRHHAPPSPPALKAAPLPRCLLLPSVAPCSPLLLWRRWRPPTPPPSQTGIRCPQPREGEAGCGDCAVAAAGDGLCRLVRRVDAAAEANLFRG